MSLATCCTLRTSWRVWGGDEAAAGSAPSASLRCGDYRRRTSTCCCPADTPPHTERTWTPHLRLEAPRLLWEVREGEGGVFGACNSLIEVLMGIQIRNRYCDTNLSRISIMYLFFYFFFLIKKKHYKSWHQIFWKSWFKNGRRMLIKRTIKVCFSFDRNADLEEGLLSAGDLLALGAASLQTHAPHELAAHHIHGLNTHAHTCMYRHFINASPRQ